GSWSSRWNKPEAALLINASHRVDFEPPHSTSEKGGQTMPMQRYLFIRRSSGGTQERPSPAQQQEMYAAFSAWQEKFNANILDLGGRLNPGGKVVRSSI